MKIELHLDENCGEVKVDVTAPAVTEEVRALLSALEGAGTVTGFREGLAAPLETAEILSFRTDGDRILARTMEGDYAVRARLGELETRLNSRRFVRVSQSEIVNLKRVKSLDLSLTGTIRMTLADGSVSYVSRRSVKKIKEALGI